MKYAQGAVSQEFKQVVKQMVQFEGRGSQRPFLEFNHRLFSALEQAKIWETTDDLLSVIKTRKSLLKFVDTLESSESKFILTNILDCEPHHYSSMVSSLIPFLKSVGSNMATISES